VTASATDRQTPRGERETTMTRKLMALERLTTARRAGIEYRPQAIDSWLELATGGEVRRYWRPWMGAMPGWAVRS